MRSDFLRSSAPYHRSVISQQKTKNEIFEFYKNKISPKKIFITVAEGKINEDFLLILLNENNYLHLSTLVIDKNFEYETEIIRELCSDSNDNIEEIVLFLKSRLKPKLPNKIFKYCKKLDSAYQSVHVSIDKGIEEILDNRNSIYLEEAKSLEEGTEFNIADKFIKLKTSLLEKIELWFKVFDLDLAYQKAKGVEGMKAYSHRISGWSNPNYKIAKNLYQQIKTNFGYGNASYFYSLLMV